jgi:hypothetical protein
LNNSKKKVTGDDYGISIQKQSKTEIAKAIANLTQMPVVTDIDANDTTIVPAEP